MSLKEKPHKGGRRFRFISRRKTQSQGGKFHKDNGDLVQMVIIIAAMVVASIVVVGGISSVTQSKGKSTAECINEATNFGQGATARDNCKKTDEEAQEKGEEAIVGNFGESSPIGGSEPEEEEEITTPTSDNCFVLNAQGDTITDYKIELEECTTDVVIPSSINGTAITSIRYDAFRNNQLTSVVIPDSVTSIENAAFRDNKLTSVVIPNSVTSINDWVFAGNQLTSVVIPDSVTSIRGVAFYNNQLISVVIPDSVTSIGPRAFSNNKLTDITIPDSVTIIDDWAFSGNQLTSVVIPDSVNFITNEAFNNNPLTSASIPSHLRFNSNAFPATTNITIRS